MAAPDACAVRQRKIQGGRMVRAFDPVLLRASGKADTLARRRPGPNACTAAPERILVKAREFVRRMQLRDDHLA